MEGEVLPCRGGKDVTIDIGVGIADDGLVSLADFTIAIDVDEAYITSLEVLTSTSSIGQVEISLATGSGCLLVGCQHASSLITVEHAYRLSNDGGDVVSTVDAGGIALCRKLSVEIDAAVVGQLLHLVDIVSGAGTYLNIEVAGDNRLGSDCYLETSVVERTAIAPVVVDTSYGIFEGLQRQQIGGVVEIVVEVNAQAIVEHIGFESEVHLAGLFP